MEILRAEDVIREILESYNRKPVGWQIASDFRGNMLALGPDTGYRLKFMIISPSERIGVGVRFDDPVDVGRLGLSPPCGFRPLSAEVAKEAIAAIASGGAAQQVMERLMRAKPVRLQDCQGKDVGAVLSGPFMSHPDLRMISPRQSDLDAKLAAEVERIFRQRYPMRASMFG